MTVKSEHSNKAEKEHLGHKKLNPTHIAMYRIRSLFLHMVDE